MPQSKIKIFGVVNHVSNQYELLKLAKTYPIKFYYLENNVRRWSKYSARPEPTTWLDESEFEWVQHYEKGKYDLAMLHTDQQHVDPNIGKGQLYRDMNEIIQDIPKIVINHGTPMWDEFYTEDLVINGGVLHTPKGEKKIDGMKNLIGDNFMIVNSYDAVKRWGWGYPVIHGLDPEEWKPSLKEPRVSISLSPGGLDAYYNRSLLTAIKGLLKEKTGFDLQHIMVNYISKDWQDYREFLGSSLIYVNPTKDSPMPRSRTEAMLMECCVLSSRYHNADEFIEHGVNGFIVPDNPMSYVDAIEQLINFNYDNAIQIGKEARRTAIKHFNIKDYQQDMYHVITEILNGNKPEWKGEKRWD